MMKSREERQAFGIVLTQRYEGSRREDWEIARAFMNGRLGHVSFFSRWELYRQDCLPVSKLWMLYCTWSCMRGMRVIGAVVCG